MASHDGSGSQGDGRRRRRGTAPAGAVTTAAPTAGAAAAAAGDTAVSALRRWGRLPSLADAPTSHRHGAAPSVAPLPTQQRTSPASAVPRRRSAASSGRDDGGEAADADCSPRGTHSAADKDWSATGGSSSGHLSRGGGRRRRWSVFAPGPPAPPLSFRSRLLSYVAAAAAIVVLFLRVRRNLYSNETARARTAALLERTGAYGGGGGRAAPAPLTVELFTAPKPFVGDDGKNQLRALESWLALTPPPAVTLLGDGAGIGDVAAAYDLRWLPDVDANVLRVPLFNAMFDITNRTTADVAVLLNADILLFDDFTFALRRLQSSLPDPHWLLVGARWDVDSLPPPPSGSWVTEAPADRRRRVAADRHWRRRLARLTFWRPPAAPPPSAGGGGAGAGGDGRGYLPPESVWQNERYRRAAVHHARTAGVLHTYGGIDLWAWTTGGPPLFDGVMPHFVVGRGRYDNWLTHEVIQAARRPVIDVSEACTFVHVHHDYHLVAASAAAAAAAAEGGVTSDASVASAAAAAAVDGADGGVAMGSGVERNFWNDGKNRKFELYINTYLSSAHGTYTNQQGTILHAPLKLASCYERSGFCLLRRVRPHVCRCEHSPFVGGAQNDPFVVTGSRVIFCGLLSSEAREQRGGAGDDGTATSGLTDSRLEDEGWTISGRLSPSSGLSSGSGPLGVPISSTSTEHLPEGRPAARTPFGLPMLLPALLEVVAARHAAAAAASLAARAAAGLPRAASLPTRRRPVVLTMANNNQQQLLLNWMCNQRRLRTADSVVIAALDDELYHFGVTRGLPIYLEDTLYHSPTEEASAETAGASTRSRPLLLALRLRVVNRLLAAGHDVLYTDPDVVWLHNLAAVVPLITAPYVDVAVASDAAAASPANAPSALSAAVLYARARPRSIAALTAGGGGLTPPTSATAAAASLYAALCGPSGERRSPDGRACGTAAGGTFPGGAPDDRTVRVAVLPGVVSTVADAGVWARADVAAAPVVAIGPPGGVVAGLPGLTVESTATEVAAAGFAPDADSPPLLAVHANDPGGRRADKTGRLRAAGLLFVDEELGLCVYTPREGGRGGAAATATAAVSAPP
ncbi:hypothetical protein MMPV_003038 [Pyropia vietnamensis]